MREDCELELMVCSIAYVNSYVN